MRCDDCQTLLLDHLYGLLEPSDAAGVEQHLSACAGCSASLERAGKVQGLLARAARSEFPHVRFAAPAAEEIPVSNLSFPAPAENGTPSIPSVGPAPHRQVSIGGRWAIAAGILILAPALLLPLSSRSREYDLAKAKADDAAVRLANARGPLEQAITRQDEARSRAEARYTAAWSQTQSLLNDWVRAEKAADTAEKNRPFEVIVARPQSVVAGAQNEFHVAIQDRGNLLRGKSVVAEVRDQDGKTLHTQRIETARKDDSGTIRLPAKVWTRVKPQLELFLSVAAVDDTTAARTELHEPIRLYGPVYTTLLVTDKSSYRPGEQIFFRSLTLDRVSFRPPDREQVLHFSLRRAGGTPVAGSELYGTTGLVRVADGSVEPVRGPDGAPLRGVGTGAIVLPADLADGDYVLTLTELPGPGGRPPAQAFPVRKLVEVRSGLPERFTKTIGFAAASFAAGQAVDGWAEVKSQDKPLAGVNARAVVTVDGKPLPLVRITPQPVGPDGKPVPKTGPEGRVRIRFVLPKELPRGDVRLLVTFTSEGAEESVARRVPITGRDIVIEFFPEGGNLIAGVPNRVYVRATSSDGKPVDIRGEVAAGDEVVARVDSPKDDDEPGVNRGLGSFTFTPRADAAYRFKLAGMPDRPPFELPKVQPDGVAMTVPAPVIGAGEPIIVRLPTTAKPRSLVVGAYTRGRMTDTQRVEVKPGQATEVRLVTARDPRGGVTRVTVFEVPADTKADLIPVAERLVFRRPGEVLNLSARAGAPGTVFAPGNPVELTIAATDEKGNPVAAIVWATAVNAAAAPGANDRSLPTHFLLAGEIQTPDDLEYADFLLTDHPKAAGSLDLVLATQGWRRFVEQSRPGAVARGDRRGVELMVKSGAFPVAASTGTSHHRRLHEQYWPKYEESVKELDAAGAEKTSSERANPAIADLFAMYEARRQETADLTAAMQSATAPLIAVRQWVNVSAGALAVLAAIVGMVAVARPGGIRGLVPLVAAAATATGLAIFLALQSSRPVPLDEKSPPPGAGLPNQPIAETPGGEPKVAPGSVRPPHLVQGSNNKKGIVEPRAFSGMGDPTKPPKTPVPRKIPGIETISFDPSTSGASIPDSRLQGPRRSANRLMSRPAPVSADAERRVLSTLAEYARDRALPLALPIEAALPNPGEKTPAVPTVEPDAYERIRGSVPWAPPLLVREYAAPRPGAAPGELLAADTVLWKPVIVLPTDGKAAVSFHVGVAPGGYQVVVAGHTLDGRIGSVRMVLPVLPSSSAAPPPK